MISIKRPNPAISANTIIIDSDSQEIQPQSIRKIVKIESSQSAHSSPYQAIPQVPAFTLTVKDMNSDPIQLFHRLESQYSQYGAVKLTTSQAWNCPFTFGNVDRPASVRRQILQDLTTGKPFEQKVQCERISQYKKDADEFAKQYKFKTSPKGSTIELRRQHQYWNLVTKTEFSDKIVAVQYAADLPSSQYGSGFPTRKLYNWKDSDFQYETNLFNLNNIYKSPTSLLRIIEQKGQKISGITQPWMYVGMQFATFCWHVQDLFLNSINYNHSGSTKTWYVVSGKQKQQFDEYVHRNYQNSRKKNLLQKITLMIDPLQLMKAGIKVYKVNQRPRDYVLTFVKAYHAGFSHGFNIGQAVNFIGYGNIDGIKQALRFYEQQQNANGKKLKPQVLSYEWMVYQTINQRLQLSQLHSQKIGKEYRRMLNRQYVFIKSTSDKYGGFVDVKIVQSKKKYYTNMCSYCRNYLYLSSIECAGCHKNLCGRHIDKCQCMDKKKILVVRELNQDRNKIMEIVPMIAAHVIE